MPKNGNIELVRYFYELLDKRDLTGARELLTRNFVLHYVGIPEALNSDTSIELIRQFYSAFPDYVHVIDEIISSGDVVAVRFTFHATHREEFEGIPATGNQVTYSGMHMVKIQDGKIEHIWALEDSLGLMQQLGMELEPKAGN